MPGLLSLLPLLAFVLPFSPLSCAFASDSSLEPAAVGVAGVGQPILLESNKTTEIFASAWYAGWRGAEFTPQNVSWSKYSMVTYAFGITTDDDSMVSLQDADKTLLPEFVKAAHENNVKASLSIGGWTGSQHFSKLVATPDKRKAFVKVVVDLVQRYNLDGIDFDWEYPNKAGIGCNEMSPDDSHNFLLFLQKLRKSPAGKHLVITAAVAMTPFADANGTPMSDVSDFSKVLDYIAIMAYDTWGSWTPSAGPNAPLDDSCSPNKQGSATAAVAAWSAAGFPAKQILLGVPAYGHSYHVDKSAAFTSSGKLSSYPMFDKALQPKGDSADGEAGIDQCGNPAPVSGVFNYWGLIEGKFLKPDGRPEKGIAHSFDECSQTPFVYNPKTEVFVSYDNAKSFTAKGQFILDKNLGGFSMWEASGDYHDTLLDAITTALGVDDEAACMNMLATVDVEVDSDVA